MENKDQLETTTNDLKIRLEDNVENQAKQLEKIEVKPITNIPLIPTPNRLIKP
jgi:hypothetical protein